MKAANFPLISIICISLLLSCTIHFRSGSQQIKLDSFILSAISSKKVDHALFQDSDDTTRLVYTLRRNSWPHCISSSQSAFCKYSSQCVSQILSVYETYTNVKRPYRRALMICNLYRTSKWNSLPQPQCNFLTCLLTRQFQKRNFLENQSAKLTNWSPDPTKESCFRQKCPQIEIWPLGECLGGIREQLVNLALWSGKSCVFWNALLLTH